MGRAVLKVAEIFVGMFLENGGRAGRPSKPIPGVKVVDAQLRDWCVELLLESPGLAGPDDATFANAPALQVTVEAIPVLEGDVAVQLVADHMRNAEGFCECGKLGLADGRLCERCRSKAALDRVPGAFLELAIAARRAAGELLAGDPVPEDPGERHGEVPGA